MDGVRLGRLGRRCGHIAALTGLVAVIGGASAPVAAFAAEQEPAQVLQSGPQVDRTGFGFQEHHELRDGQELVDVNVCSRAIGTMQVHCDARLRTDTQARTARPARAGQPRPNGLIGNNGGYDPSYLQSAYNVTSSIGGGAGHGQVVAIVDAFDDPNASADVAYYRTFFGLPALPNCATWPSATACLRKVNQTGGVGPYPTPDSGWSEEIALDLDMVSAICPSCSILLVEANSNTYADLTTAVDKAVALGANVVSNSYGGGEWSGESGFDSFYNHSGVAITVSSGDGGYGADYPAASPFVTAVGGTSLNQATNTGARDGTESAWTGAGSGCSLYETKPSWQKDTACARRTVADVSAVADPATGVWIYDSYGGSGWNILGGTSAASPIVGAVYALAGNSLTSGPQLNGDPYSHATALFDATGGSNGSCGGTYLCTGVVGYDGPTGLGTPNGTAAFTNGSVVPPADFSVSASSASLRATRGGASVSDTLTLSAANGYHNSVQLSVSGVPAGVTPSFSPTSVTPTATSTLSLRASTSAKRGTYTLTVTATGSDGKVHTRAVQLTVQ
jgi:subtilase family serine protease